MRKKEKCDSVGCPKMSPGVEKDRRKSTVPCVPMKVSRLRGDSKKKKEPTGRGVCYGWMGERADRRTAQAGNSLVELYSSFRV